MKFTDLGLCEPILRAITSAGYDVPTPIQTKAIPYVLQGRDVLGCAQTGTGKTAAFCLPMAQRLMEHLTPPAAAHAAAHASRDSHNGHHPAGHGARSTHGHSSAAHKPKRPIRALILSPTRELTLQIAENLAIYAKNSKLKHTVIYGGVGQGSQVRDLREGVDIVVATPGRLEDLKQQGYVDLRHVEIFVLDEADRMLDMGFIEPIRRIAAAVPKQRQTLLFSATMAKEIRKLADTLLHNPVAVEATPAASMPTLIEHTVFHVSRGDKPALLSHLLNSSPITRALVFTRTKHGADKVVKRLSHDGIHAEAIHGNKRQNVRQRTLANFKSGRTPVLVATDIAARGIDVDEISHVINYEMPNEPETYVHRTGRTGRAGATGKAVSFCDHDERSYLRLIEKLVKRTIEVVETPKVPRGEHPPETSEDRAREGRGHRGPRHAEASARGATGGHRTSHRAPARRDAAAGGEHPRGQARPDSRAGHHTGGHASGAAHASPKAHAHPHAKPAHAAPHAAHASARPAAHAAPHAPKQSSHRKGPPPADKGTGGHARRCQPGAGFRGKPRGDR